MKRIILFTALTVIFLSAFSQSYNDDFVGTWVYEKNDTVFKIKLQKGHTTYPGTGKSRETLVGGYSLSIKGIIQDDYIRPILDLPTIQYSKLPDYNIFIWGEYSNPKEPNYTAFRFYDMKKKHIFGTGISANSMTLLSPTTLHWKLDEKQGLWWEFEGEIIGDEEEIKRIEEESKPRGFSVPEDVIMTKER